MRSPIIYAIMLLSIVSTAVAAPPALDERPAGDDEWGYRPAAGSVSEASPPGFCWRPQQGIVSWELECGQGKGFEKIAYRVGDVAVNVHCPPESLSPGQYTWRYRGVDADGGKTAWSQARTFTIAQEAVSMPMPVREELLARIPKASRLAGVLEMAGRSHWGARKEHHTLTTPLQ